MLKNIIEKIQRCVIFPTKTLIIYNKNCPITGIRYMVDLPSYTIMQLKSRYILLNLQEWADSIF